MTTGQEYLLAGIRAGIAELNAMRLAAAEQRAEQVPADLAWGDDVLAWGDDVLAWGEISSLDPSHFVAVDVPIYQVRAPQGQEAEGIQLPQVIWMRTDVIQGLTLDGNTPPPSCEFEVLTRARTAKAAQDMADTITLQIEIGGSPFVSVISDFATPPSREQAEARYFEHTVVIRVCDD